MKSAEMGESAEPFSICCFPSKKNYIRELAGLNSPSRKSGEKKPQPEINGGPKAWRTKCLCWINESRLGTYCYRGAKKEEMQKRGTGGEPRERKGAKRCSKKKID